METIRKEAFKVIGLKVRTTNENGQSANDIGKLWEKFMSENIIAKIPNKTDFSIFSIYTNYENDHTKPYDTILGCQVSTLDDIPHGMIGAEFTAGNYKKYVAKGNLKEGLVYNAWTEIWSADLNRTFTADFEVYGEKAQDPTHAEVEIFVGIQ
ncbi:GyrI-like domain-containing protein [Maribacter sp. 2210JD10-5]|uniref:GyrI-like domain-containing protein n=1 Tax=Maribacter sp. 2210JD10-5 TaxID=3386272 RepID=UPI0039BD81A3